MQFYLKSLLQQITIVLHFIAVKLFIEYSNDNNLLLIGMNTFLLFSSSALKKTSLLMFGEPFWNDNNRNIIKW